MSITLRTLAMLSVLIAGGLSAATARSEDSAATLDDTEASTTTALESRIAALEAQLQQGMSGGYDAQEMMTGGPAYGPADGDCGCGKAHGCGGAYCPPPCSNGCCCCPYNPWTLSAGVYHVKPHWKTNPAFSTEVTVGGVETTTQTDFDYDADAAPFVSLTYRTRYGLGVQARGWWYDDSASIAVVNPGGGTEIFTAAPLGLGLDSDDAGNLTFDSSLQIDVVDFLLTYQMQFECGSLEFAAGARHARIKQAYRYSEVPAGGGLAEDAIDSSHSFEGAGPSFSLEGRLAATRRLTLFATCRYSLLFGHAEQAASLRDDNVLEDQNFQENEDLLPIAELDLGAEYAIRIGCSELFISAALVSQVWQGAGNSANNDIILTDDDPQDVSDKNADLGLWGLRAEIGARF